MVVDLGELLLKLFNLYLEGLFLFLVEFVVDWLYIGFIFMFKWEGMLNIFFEIGVFGVLIVVFVVGGVGELIISVMGYLLFESLIVNDYWVVMEVMIVDLDMMDVCVCVFVDLIGMCYMWFWFVECVRELEGYGV